MRLNISTARARILAAGLIAAAALGFSVHSASARHLNGALSVSNPSCAFFSFGGFTNPVVAEARGLNSFNLPTTCTLWASGATATADCATGTGAVKTQARLGFLSNGGQGTFMQNFWGTSSALTASWTAIASTTGTIPAFGSCAAQSASAISFGQN